MVPESRRVAVRLPAYALAVPARRSPVRDVPADPRARSVGGQRCRSLRPPQARGRRTARRNRARRAARRPRVGRARAGMGRHGRLARARRRQCVLGARFAGAARRPGAALAPAVRRGAQLDDVQPRARGRPGACGSLRAQARNSGVVRHQLGFLPRPRRRRPARAAGRAAAGEPRRGAASREPCASSARSRACSPSS